MPNKDKLRICTYVTETEYALIKERTKATGISMSRYAREVLLGYKPRSLFDQDAVLAMMKANADLGRLGGLFKLAITEGREKANINDFREFLEELRKHQSKLSWCCKQVVDLYKKKRK